MIKVKINYQGPGGVSQFASFDTTEDQAHVLETLGHVVATGKLYTVMDGERHVISIPGRRIETVEVRPA